MEQQRRTREREQTSGAGSTDSEWRRQNRGAHSARHLLCAQSTSASIWRLVQCCRGWMRDCLCSPLSLSLAAAVDAAAAARLEEQRVAAAPAPACPCAWCRACLLLLPLPLLLLLLLPLARCSRCDCRLCSRLSLACSLLLLGPSPFLAAPTLHLIAASHRHRVPASAEGPAHRRLELPVGECPDLEPASADVHVCRPASSPGSRFPDPGSRLATDRQTHALPSARACLSPKTRPSACLSRTL